MNRLPSHFMQLNITAPLLDVVPVDKNCWLVGGSLRDDILGKQPDDFDLAFDFDPTDLARSFASRLNGTFIHLDPVRHQSRIVFSSGEHRYTLDLTPLRAPTLVEDLSLRDFTCNALACDLSKPDTVIDPLGGERDLLDGILRTCSDYVLKDDPLRIIKGIRHVVELNLRLHEEACQQLVAYRHLLNTVAVERITSEMGRIFAHPQVSVGASMMSRFGLLDHISASSDYSIDMMGLQHVLAAERRFRDSQLFAEFKTPVEESWPLYALVRLCRAVLLKKNSETKQPFTFLKQSNKSISIINLLLGLPHLEQSPELELDTPRKRALWLDRYRPSPLAAALYGASSDRFSGLDLVACLSDWLAQQVNGRVPDLVSPAELVEKWGIEPGEDLGRGLEAVRMDEIRGRISRDSDREEIVRSYFKMD